MAITMRLLKRKGTDLLFDTVFGFWLRPKREEIDALQIELLHFFSVIAIGAFTFDAIMFPSWAPESKIPSHARIENSLSQY
jgi:hypothetical protein